MKKVMDEISNVFSKIKEEHFSLLEELILKSRKIFIFGTGRSGFIGRCFCMRLCHLEFIFCWINDNLKV